IETVTADLKTDKQKNESEFERGQLLVNQGRADLAWSRFLNRKESSAEDKKKATKLEDEARVVLKDAISLLEGLADKVAEADPLKPRARVWCARAMSLNADTPANVTRKLRAAAEEADKARDIVALRQVYYFNMLQLFESEV